MKTLRYLLTSLFALALSYCVSSPLQAAAPGAVYVDGNANLLAPFNAPSGLTLQVLSGGALTFNSGSTLTLNGSLAGTTTGGTLTLGGTLNVTGVLEQSGTPLSSLYLPATGTPNSQSGSSYTAALTDIGVPIIMTSSSANAVTIPPLSSVAFPLNSQLTVEMGGTGTTSIVAGTGVTINGITGGSVTAGTFGAIGGQYGTIGLIKTGANTWVTGGPYGPGPIAGTTLALTSTGTQETVGYDGSNYQTTTVASNGAVTYNESNAAIWNWNYQGSTVFEYASNTFQLNGSAKCIAFNTSGSYNSGNKKIDLGNGNGISDAGAANTTGLVVNNVANAFTFSVSGEYIKPAALSALGTPAAGTVATINDATSPANGSTATGGGSSFALVLYNGTNWIVVAH